VRVMTFGVVLFTLLVQSMTMKPILRRLGISTRDPIRIEYETRHGRMVAFRAAALHLDKMQRDGVLSQQTWEILRPHLVARAEQMALDVRSLQHDHPELAVEDLENARRELLRAERSTLQGLQHDGVISDEVFEKLVIEIDAGLAGERSAAAQVAKKNDPETAVDAD
jgi:CPA1 family monovalent cation:H+ antiporter